MQLIEHEEVIAADWNNDCSLESSSGNSSSSSSNSSSRGCWELLLAGTGANMKAKAVAAALQNAESPSHTHAHRKKKNVQDKDSSEEDSLHRSAGGSPSASAQGAGSAQDSLIEDGVLYAHHVWLATGSVVDVKTEPVFASEFQVFAHHLLYVVQRNNCCKNMSSD